MIDTNSVEAFATSLPKTPSEVEHVLLLKMRLTDAISPATASLAQRGYIGCLPFAHTQGDEVVLRLLPNRKLIESPVAIAWWSYIEGTTIAPDIRRFIVGRLAQIDAASPEKMLSEEQRQQLLQFAAEFDKTSSTEAMIYALDELRLIEDDIERLTALWNAANCDDPLCQSLIGAWTLEGSALGEWVDKAICEIPEVDIVKRLYVAHHVRYKTNVDVTEAAWDLVEGDDVFDSTYIGFSKGQAIGAWEREALNLCREMVKGSDSACSRT